MDSEGGGRDSQTLFLWYGETPLLSLPRQAGLPLERKPHGTSPRFPR